jgi:hypothetical protein
LCAGTDANHFGDINEMVGDAPPALHPLTGRRPKLFKKDLTLPWY